MELPKDPMMLFSFINMKLRDYYPSLDALCADLNVSKEDIVNRLKAVGFEYNPSQNKFWSKRTQTNKKGCLPKGKQPFFILSGVISIKHD